MQKITLFIYSLFNNAYIGSEYDRTVNEQGNGKHVQKSDYESQLCILTDLIHNCNHVTSRHPQLGSIDPLVPTLELILVICFAKY